MIWFKPFTFNQFLERSYIQLLWNDPQALTQTHLLDDVPLLDFNQNLTSRSSAQSDRMTETGKDILALLEQYDPEDLNDDDRISYLIFKWFLEENIAGAQFSCLNYPINPYSGEHTRFPKFMTGAHQITGLSDAEDYLSRLSKWPNQVLEIIDELEKRKAKGVVVPTRILDQCIEQCGTLKQRNLEGDVIYSNYVKRLGHCEKIGKQDSVELGDACRKLLFEEVKPAYGRLQEYLILLRNSSKEVHGVWRFENGAEYYQYCIRRHTSLDIEPETLYRTGIKELESISEKLTAELTALGYTELEGLDKQLQKFDEDHGTPFTSSDSGYQAVLDYLNSVVKDASDNIGPYFHFVPEDALVVERMTPRRERGSPLAYYTRSADGLSGIVFINLSRPADLPKYSMPTIIHHEGFPGHHLQRSIRLSNTELPSFRKFLPFTAYTEGWAMYAEYLADEMGLIGSSEVRIGLLRSDMLRTVRLLCDVGIHHKKWLRDQAINYLVEKTGIGTELAEREIDRYIVDPGQGCAYKVGQLKFFELRKFMENELKSDFDVRDFHRIVLENGAMPLPVLEMLVKQETEKLKANYQTMVPEPEQG